MSSWGHISYGQSKIQCEKLSSALTHKPITVSYTLGLFAALKLATFALALQFLLKQCLL